MNPVLSARGVGFGYGDRDILRGVSVDLSPGEVTILLGPNGAGKSTLIRILSGILAPREGEVLLCGRPPGEFRRREMARLLSVVGQDPPVDFPMTVAAYVGLGRFPHQGFFGGTSPEDREQVERAMERTGRRFRLDAGGAGRQNGHADRNVPVGAREDGASPSLPRNCNR